MKKREKSIRLRGSVQVVNEVFRGYRRYLALLAGVGAFSAFLDGLSIAAVIPLLSFLLGSASASAGRANAFFLVLFHALHIPFQFRSVLLLIAFLLLVRVGVHSLFVAIRARVSSRFLSEQINRLHALALSASWPFVMRQKAGYLQNAILSDARRVTDLFEVLAQVAQSATGLVVYLAVAVGISPFLTFLTLAAGAVLLFFLRPLFGKTREFSEQTLWTETELTQRLGEHLGGFKVLKALDAVPGALAVATEDAERLRQAARRSIFATNLGNIIVQPFGFLFAMGLFAFTYASGHFELATFAATLYLIQKIFVYLESAQASWNVATKSVPFAERMLSLREELAGVAEPPRQGGAPFTLEREIAFEHVSLSYDRSGAKVSDLSFVIPRGSFVGIVGPSAAGKTSVVDLLLRLFTPTVGRITVDGVSAEAISLYGWRRRIGYVPQDPFLIHASVRDNVRFYDAAISDAEVERAARAANIFDDIVALPNGFDTLVGERGAALSGGQRQRVALARALARAPAVLVLDEVTSSLDSETEARIINTIQNLRGSVTLVVVAHRLASVMNADTLLVLSGGRLVEEGAPRALLARPGSYLARVAKFQQTR